ncbi:MAG: hypothetical protein KF812_07580 [Fimbriimonadaceae bacterium]|nr:hypothetical protein [Fimbriimonadaceae bacterium]
MKTYRLILSIVAVAAIGLTLIACDPAKYSPPPTTTNTDGTQRPAGNGSVESVVATEEGEK